MKPNPKLFPIPNFFDTESDTFFDTNFSIPIPILFSIPKFYETDTNTFFDTKFFRNRYRYFFRYQKKSKPIPILLSIPKFFETDTDTIKKHRKVSKPILFSIPIFFETDTNTFIDTKIFRNRYHQKT